MEKRLLIDRSKNMEEKVEKIQNALFQMDCSVNSNTHDIEIRNVIMGAIGSMGYTQ